MILVASIVGVAIANDYPIGNIGGGGRHDITDASTRLEWRLIMIIRYVIIELARAITQLSRTVVFVEK